jgi:S1-C subfamily serine protease
VRIAVLGVGTAEITSQMAEQLDLDTDAGVLVDSVEQGSGADGAGVRRGDVILAVDGTAVDTPDDLGAAIRGLAPGDDVELRVIRDGSQETLTATLGTRSASND